MVSVYSLLIQSGDFFLNSEIKGNSCNKSETGPSASVTGPCVFQVPHQVRLFTASHLGPAQAPR